MPGPESSKYLLVLQCPLLKRWISQPIKPIKSFKVRSNLLQAQMLFFLLFFIFGCVDSGLLIKAKFNSEGRSFVNDCYSTEKELIK